MKKIRKAVKGFTLIELIIVMAMMGILMIGILNLVMPVNSIFRDSTEYQYERATNETITNFIQARVRYATDLNILNDCASMPTGSGIYADYSIIEIDNSDRTYNNRTVRGKIAYKEPLTPKQDFMDNGFYGEYIYIFGITGSSSNFTMDIEIDKVNKKNGADVIEKKFDSTSTISLKNMQVGGTSIKLHLCSDSAQLALVPADISATASAAGLGNTYIIYKEPDPVT
ncbi:MAG: type II secretion system protein [Oscillospiraceae bacterium]